MKETRTAQSFGENNTRSLLRSRSGDVCRPGKPRRSSGSADPKAVGPPVHDVGVNLQTWTTALRGWKVAIPLPEARVYLNHLVD